jgi:hypothetical protein
VSSERAEYTVSLGSERDGAGGKRVHGNVRWDMEICLERKQRYLDAYGKWHMQVYCSGCGSLLGIRTHCIKASINFPLGSFRHLNSI